MIDADWSATAERTYRRCRGVIGALAPIVPRARRDAWEDEWNGELWYRIHDLDRAGMLSARARRDLFVRSLGALAHALWVRRSEWRLDMILQDLKYAARTNLKRPAFSLLVVATLAIGIGANSAMFSIVNAVLIQPLPYPQSSELVYAYGSFKGGNQAGISPPDFLDYRAQTHAFSSFAARQAFAGSVVLGGATEPERVAATAITYNFFRTLGVRPLLGRDFLPDDEQGGPHRLVMLSHGLWMRRFAGDPKVVGTTVSIEGEPHTIVGVMPPVLERTLPEELWRPFPFHIDETSVRRFHMLRGFGRLRPGMTLAGAQAEMDAIAKRLENTYPENASWHLRLVPYREVVVGGTGSILLVLLGAVGLVLLIACGNVASLMLARATARQSEIAVRTALGASRTRVVRQLLTESVLLGASAGVLGLLIAVALVRGVRRFAVDLLPRMSEVHIDATAVLVTMAIAIVTGIIFGLAPALHAGRQDLAMALRSLGRASGTRRVLRLRDALVVAQVALSLVLLVGAGLLLRSLWLVQRVEPGFDPRGVLSARISLPNDRYKTHASREQFWDTFLERVRAVPGVESAAATTMLPLVSGGDTYYWIEGNPPASDADKRNAQVNVASDDYFSAMKIAVVEGRALGAMDRTLGNDSLGRGTIVINQQMAQRLFPQRSALGSRLVVDIGQPFLAEIVGIAADVRAFGQANEAPDIMYFSVHQMTQNYSPRSMSLVVRSGGDPTPLTAPIRTVLRGLEPGVPLASVASMNQLLRNSVALSYFRSRLLAAFALVALVLSLVGLYGVLAYAVTQRTREIGVRIALGAQARQVSSLVVRRGMGLVVSGIALGLLGAYGAVRLIRGMLFAVSPLDPPVFIIVVALLGIAGLLACVVPARRATRISPMAALREE